MFFKHPPTVSNKGASPLQSMKQPALPFVYSAKHRNDFAQKSEQAETSIALKACLVDIFLSLLVLLDATDENARAKEGLPLPAQSNPWVAKSHK